MTLPPLTWWDLQTPQPDRRPERASKRDPQVPAVREDPGRSSSLPMGCCHNDPLDAEKEDQVCPAAPREPQTSHENRTAACWWLQPPDKELPPTPAQLRGRDPHPRDASQCWSGAISPRSWDCGFLDEQKWSSERLSHFEEGAQCAPDLVPVLKRDEEQSTTWELVRGPYGQPWSGQLFWPCRPESYRLSSDFPLAVWPWVNHFPSLVFGFSVIKMRTKYLSTCHTWDKGQTW